jgi:hypothetical protein
MEQLTIESELSCSTQEMDTSINTGPEPEQNQDTPARRLAELEQIVEKGLRTNPDVVSALAEIHSRKLYRLHGFKSFQSYLKEQPV